MSQHLVMRPGALGSPLFVQQVRSWLLVLVAGLGSMGSALAQTVIIGSAAVPVVSPAISDYYYGPLYLSGNGSSFNYSRYAYLYTAAELSIPNGATITQLEWLKADAGAVTGANTLNVLLSNTPLTALLTRTSWATLSTGATTAYTNTTQSVTGAAGTYLAVPVTGFTYTGGNLLVLTDWKKGGTATGAINFVTNAAADRAIGYATSVAFLTTSTALTTVYGNRRPTLRITYVVGTPCTVPPTAGAATAAANPVCVGNAAYLSLSGASSGAGLTYQWQSSPTGTGGSFTNLAGATGSTYLTPALTQAMYYQAVVTCSGQAATSAAVQVSVLTPTYATLPYTQTFESAWLSRCNAADVPDASWLNTPVVGNNSWRRDDNGTAANWDVPTSGAYTPVGSQGSSHSARFHNAGAINSVVGTLDLYANLSAPGTKRLSFDYVKASTGVGSIDVLLSTDGGATFGATPLLTVATVSTFTAQTLDLTTTSATAVIRFQATSDFGFSDTGLDNVQLRALSVTATTPSQAAATLTVYPNPTRDGQLTLELQGYQEAVQLTICNALGQRVCERTLAASALKQRQTLYLPELTTGVYTLLARTASGRVAVRRIMRE